MEPYEGHNERFRRDTPVLCKAEYEALEYFITDSETRFPQDRSQIVTARFAAVLSIIFCERHL